MNKSKNSKQKIKNAKDLRGVYGDGSGVDFDKNQKTIVHNGQKLNLDDVKGAEVTKVSDGWKVSFPKGDAKSLNVGSDSFNIPKGTDVEISDSAGGKIIKTGTGKTLEVSTLKGKISIEPNTQMSYKSSVSDTEVYVSKGKATFSNDHLESAIGNQGKGNFYGSGESQTFKIDGENNDLSLKFNEDKINVDYEADSFKGRLSLDGSSKVDLSQDYGLILTKGKNDLGEEQYRCIVKGLDNQNKVNFEHGGYKYSVGEKAEINYGSIFGEPTKISFLGSSGNIGGVDYDPLKDIFVDKAGSPLETEAFKEKFDVVRAYFNNGRIDSVSGKSDVSTGALVTTGLEMMGEAVVEVLKYPFRLLDKMFSENFA